MSSTETLSKIHDLLGQLSTEELMIVARAAHVRAQNAAKVELKVGDNVSFTTKAGTAQKGVLIKKNRKCFQVLVGHTTWRVSSTMLKKVA